MNLKDLVVTPLFFIAIVVVAYFVRPLFTNSQNRKYFMPALILRMVAAILLGVLYQYYYNGGDTFLYHTNGSAVIYDVLLDDPGKGLSILFNHGDFIHYKYTSQIRYYHDPSSFAIVQIATFFDLFTFATYSATALLFACVSFSGMWALYAFFTKSTEVTSGWLALAVLFTPSLVFWGSGILKDTITLALLGWGTFALYEGILRKRHTLIYSVVLLACFYGIYVIKLYVLLCFLPPLILYVFLFRIKTFRNIMLRILIGPFLIILAAGVGFYAIDEISSDNPRYSLDELAQTSRTTAYDIAFWTGRDSGSTYTLGELDGTFSGMLKLFPQAVNVSLFRPYVWEVNNMLMVLSALESLGIAFLTLYVFYKSRLLGLRYIVNEPVVLFCLIFAITFAFGVGISTYNFGTLSRYRIPLIPFYLGALIIYLKKYLINSSIGSSADIPPDRY